MIKFTDGVLVGTIMLLIAMTVGWYLGYQAGKGMGRIEILKELEKYIKDNPPTKDR